ncbi:S8 family serine peptidase [Vitiosangium sp. GDMCC 1.1324]|uniref:S8 family serine peptidase n=1 Tax=Vitiosangium sp. (strain GDMCC 1.1324) TaxID=2138576 RepID=UPI000D3A43E2|nr:S8 family serine peptidase [Vitiosangium sp. GDMCC 1.1324]PTL78414.1 peptidase S8 [Vitiosangium sp. GDMCC 1.1324]
MRRWAHLGLLALVACSNGKEVTGQENDACEGVEAGALPPKVQVSDGREAVLVRYRSGTRVSAASMVQRMGGQVTAQYRFVPAVAARVTPEERARLAAHPDVESIEPDLEVHALGLPVMAGSVDEYTDALRLVQAPKVWDANEDGVIDPGAPIGAGIKVCIIDSGIDRRHPELLIPYAAGHDFVDDDDDPSDETNGVRGIGHGTHVAGIIAAQLASGGTTWPTMSRGGMVGVAPGVELLIARVLNVHESASISTVLSGLEWCRAQGAHIASLSLGSSLDMGRTAHDAFKAASDAGMLIVAASGNDSAARLSYPAAYYEYVLAVGAVDMQEQVADFSNGGTGLSLVAPGVDVLSSISVQGATDPRLDVEGQQYTARSILFSPVGEYTGELIDCGQGGIGACKGGTCDGFVAYVRLSQGASLTLVEQNVMKQGAKAIVFGIDSSENESWYMSLDGPGRKWVPSLAVGRESRAAVLKNVGKRVHVNLRGVDYAWFPGTSMATPHVTGAAALVWSARPSLTASEVRTLLESTAKKLGTGDGDSRYGHGLVQAKAALDALQQMP